MFNTIYRCPRTIARHESGPLRDSRLRYLEHLVAQGAAIHTLQIAAEVTYRASICMRLDESSPVERTEIERDAHKKSQRAWPLAGNTSVLRSLASSAFPS